MIIDQLKKQYDDLYEENQEVLKQVNKMKQAAQEQNQEISKLQNFLKVLTQDSQPIRDQIQLIKESCSTLEDEPKRILIDDQLDQLEMMIINYIADQQRNAKKSKKTIVKRESPNENDQNSVNLRKRPAKLKVEYSSDSESPQKLTKKKVKPNKEMLDKANCLINDIFNFNS